MDLDFYTEIDDVVHHKIANSFQLENFSKLEISMIVECASVYGYKIIHSTTHESMMNISYYDDELSVQICHIEKYTDEWFIIVFRKKRYKCDQLEGLLENLKKFLN